MVACKLPSRIAFSSLIAAQRFLATNNQSYWSQRPSGYQLPNTFESLKLHAEPWNLYLNFDEVYVSIICVHRASYRQAPGPCRCCIKIACIACYQTDPASREGQDSKCPQLHDETCQVGSKALDVLGDEILCSIATALSSQEWMIRNAANLVSALRHLIYSFVSSCILAIPRCISISITVPCCHDCGIVSLNWSGFQRCDRAIVGKARKLQVIRSLLPSLPRISERTFRNPRRGVKAEANRNR